MYSSANGFNLLEQEEKARIAANKKNGNKNFLFIITVSLKCYNDSFLLQFNKPFIIKVQN